MQIKTTYQQHLHKIKVVVHGESGNGKTTLAGTLEGKGLIISSEAGLLSLQDKDIDFVDLANDEGGIVPKEKRIDRLAKIYQYLLTKECIDRYEWVFIDSLTEISQNMIEKLLVEYPERKDSLVLFGENAKRMRSLIKLFRDLPHYHVIFTALSTIEKDDNARRFKGIDVIGKISNQLPAFFDEVFYLGISKDKEGASKRFIATTSDNIICKDRSGKLGAYEQPNLALIFNKILGGKKDV